MENINKNKVNFYIDGFNFYYGLKRIIEHKPDWKKFYWIDIVSFCSQFLNEGEEIGKVIYFTARPKSAEKTKRQNILLNCNLKINLGKFEVVYGRYSNKEMKCNASGGCKRRYDHLEEKETDVNLAIQMIIDSYEKVCGKMILISGDTDFVPPLKKIKKDHKHVKTMVLFPPGQHSSHLSQICPHNKNLDKFKPKWNRSMMPNEVVTKDGSRYLIPEKWKLKN